MELSIETKLALKVIRAQMNEKETEMSIDVKEEAEQFRKGYGDCMTDLKEVLNHLLTEN